MLTKVDMLRELAAIASDPDFERDPAGMLKAWAAVASGEVDETDRVHLVDDTPSGRRQAILTLARQRGGVRLADVREMFPHYVSETLRLDLRELCERGELYKVADNRWTCYLPW